jgi:hypothetical protein
VSDAKAIVSAIFACNSADCPRPFALWRQTDVTGVSGEGTVAHGVQFADGQVVIRWLGKYASTVVWESMDAAMKVHGHDGKTRVVWVASDFSEMALAEQEAATAERERIRGLLAADQMADHAPIESMYGLSCRTCVAWQDAPVADGGETEFGIAIPEQWPCPVARALEVGP